MKDFPEGPDCPGGMEAQARRESAASRDRRVRRARLDLEVRTVLLFDAKKKLPVFRSRMNLRLSANDHDPNHDQQNRTVADSREPLCRQDSRALPD